MIILCSALGFSVNACARIWEVFPSDALASAIVESFEKAHAGDMILFRPGVYFPPERLSPRNNGHEGMPIVIRGCESGDVVFKARGNKYGFWLSNKKNITIENILLEDFSGCGVKLVRSDGCEIRNIRVVNSTSHNISIEYGNGNLVENCICIGSRACGIAVLSDPSGRGGNDNVVQGNLSEGNLRQGILITGNRTIVRNNTCRGNGSTAPYDHGIYCVGQNNRIVGNTCVNHPNGSGIRVGARNHLIRENVCRENGRSGIVIAGSNDSRNLELIGNVLEHNRLDGIEINALAYQPKDLDIRENIFRNNFRTNLWIKDGVRQVSVENNIFYQANGVQVAVDTEPSLVKMRANRYLNACRFRWHGKDIPADRFFEIMEPGTVCPAD